MLISYPGGNFKQHHVLTKLRAKPPGITGQGESSGEVQPASLSISFNPKNYQHYAIIFKIA